MISTRMHAEVDVMTAGALATVAACTPAVRGVAFAAAAAGTGLALTTDYEGGAVPLLGMGTHRLLDAGLGTLLCVAGARRGGAGGWALTLAGMAQLALAVGTDAAPHAGPPDTLYRPTNKLKPFADGVWIVDDGLGPDLPVRMTVIRLRGGDLLLHSPTRYDPVLRAALERIGRIRHLVAPNSVHWLHLKAWQDAVPDTLSWAAPGLRQRGQVRRSGVRLMYDLGDRPPSPWAEEVEQAVVRGSFGFAEVVMLHRASRTALFVDLVQNVERQKLPWVLRPLAHALGNLAPDGRAPAHLRAVMRLFRPRSASARRVLDWAPERVLVTHGRPIEADGAVWLRRSLAWLASA